MDQYVAQLERQPDGVLMAVLYRNGRRAHAELVRSVRQGRRRAHDLLCTAVDTAGRAFLVDVFRINRDGSLTGTESVTVPGGVAGEGIVVARARPTPRCPPAARNLPAVGGRLGPRRRQRAGGEPELRSTVPLISGRR